MRQLAVGTVLSLKTILVSEDFVMAGAFQEHQWAVTEQTVELALHPFMARHELTLSVCVAFEVNGLNGVFGLRHFS